MILHSIRIGERQIHVRTDDCDAQALERVHETVRLVERMSNRVNIEAYGLLVGLVAFLASMAITLSTMSPGAAQVAIPLSPCVMGGAGGWFLIRNVAQQRQLADAAHLQTLTMVSIRCRDFVLECEEASPDLSRVLGNFVERPQTA